ncbi:MAG: hypothetical protein WEB00_02095 [Dehalococcoidia bacterium]
MATKAATSLLDRLDEGAAAFGGELQREYYLNGAGLKEDLVIAPIFERYAWMFERKVVDSLQRMRPGDERYPALREFVVDAYMENSVKRISEGIAERETKDSIDWDGESVPYRSIAPLIANESNPERRRHLDTLRSELTGQQNDLREDRWDSLHAGARDLGYSTYVDLCDDVSRLHLHDLAEIAERFLWATEAVYRDRLERLLRDSGIPPARAEKCDLAFIFRAPQYDGLFPAERLLPALEATLSGLGIDLSSQANVYLDTEARPLKSPRAFCSAIDVPGEIKLVINPQGGQDDYRALLHEAGHTEHFAHVPADMPYAFRGLGDNSVTEGWAFVVEHVAKNPHWLQKVLGVADAADFLAFSSFQQLYLLRRYSAKLLYELELHVAANPRGKAKRYADLLTASTGVRYSPVDYLFDVDDGFYAAKYLRAWIFEAQVRRTLEDRYGEEWYATADGGAQLREWWSYGQRYSVEGLLQKAGQPGLDIGPLQEELLA